MFITQSFLPSLSFSPLRMITFFIINSWTRKIPERKSFLMQIADETLPLHIVSWLLTSSSSTWKNFTIDTRLKHGNFRISDWFHICLKFPYTIVCPSIALIKPHGGKLSDIKNANNFAQFVKMGIAIGEKCFELKGLLRWVISRSMGI